MYPKGVLGFGKLAPSHLSFSLLREHDFVGLYQKEKRVSDPAALYRNAENSKKNLPIGVTNAFPPAIASCPDFRIFSFCPLFGFPVFLPPPKTRGLFSSFKDSPKGVFGALLPGVFGCSCLVLWFRGLAAAAV